MTNPRLYSAAQLRDTLANQFEFASFDPVVMNDAYCAATRAWVEKQFAGYLWNFQIARGQLAYSHRGNQCEHYALRAALEVVDLFRQMPDSAVPATAESIAVACCKYLNGAERPSSAVWHEVNLWFFDGAWYPWEPQTRTFFDFTEAERLTVQQVIIP